MNKLTAIIIIATVILLNIVLIASTNNVQYRYLIAICSILFCIYRLWESFFTSDDRSKRISDPTLVSTSIVYYITAILGLFDYYLCLQKINIFVTIIGVLVMFSSFLLRRRSIKMLQKNWSIILDKDLLTNRNNILVKSGPYKLVRHPIYLSYILDLIGLSLIFNSIISFALSFVLALPFYIYRAKREERIMKEIYGDDYIIYIQITKLMIPKLY